MSTDNVMLPKRKASPATSQRSTASSPSNAYFSQRRCRRAIDEMSDILEELGPNTASALIDGCLRLFPNQLVTKSRLDSTSAKLEAVSAQLQTVTGELKEELRKKNEILERYGLSGDLVSSDRPGHVTELMRHLALISVPNQTGRNLSLHWEGIQPYSRKLWMSLSDNPFFIDTVNQYDVENRISRLSSDFTAFLQSSTPSANTATTTKIPYLQAILGGHEYLEGIVEEETNLTERLLAYRKSDPSDYDRVITLASLAIVAMRARDHVPERPPPRSVVKCFGKPINLNLKVEILSAFNDMFLTAASTEIRLVCGLIDFQGRLYPFSYHYHLKLLAVYTARQDAPLGVGPNAQDNDVMESVRLAYSELPYDQRRSQQKLVIQKRPMFEESNFSHACSIQFLHSLILAGSTMLGPLTSADFELLDPDLSLLKDLECRKWITCLIMAELESGLGLYRAVRDGLLPVGISGTELSLITFRKVES